MVQEERQLAPHPDPLVLQLEWNTTSNILTEEDAEIHLQGRQKWYNPELKVSTAHAAYFIQKSCDPDAAPGDPAFYQGCTPENNNMRQPFNNPVNWHIFRRAKDLAFILKALYESHPVVKQLGIYLANGGAGSYLKFPSHIRDGRTNFTSVGCDWGRVINPMTNQFILNAEDRARCHQQPGEYNSREYNALERAWCSRQAQAKPGTPRSDEGGRT